MGRVGAVLFCVSLGTREIVRGGRNIAFCPRGRNVEVVIGIPIHDAPLVPVLATVISRDGCNGDSWPASGESSVEQVNERDWGQEGCRGRGERGGMSSWTSLPLRHRPDDGRRQTPEAQRSFRPPRLGRIAAHAAAHARRCQAGASCDHGLHNETRSCTYNSVQLALVRFCPRWLTLLPSARCL